MERRNPKRNVRYLFSGAMAFGVLLNALLPLAEAQNLNSLPGFEQQMISDEFKDYLLINPNIRRSLLQNTSLSKIVLSDSSLQQQLKDGEVRLAEIADKLQQDSESNEKTTDGAVRLGGFSRQIRERAQGDINKSISTLAGDAVSAGARAQMQVNMQDAISRIQQLNAQRNTERALAEAQAIIDAINKAAIEHPEIVAIFIQNTALLQQVLDKEVRLEDALASIDIEVPDLSETQDRTEKNGNETDVVNDEDADETSQDSSTDNAHSSRALSHLTGSYYQVNGNLIADLNKAPETSLMQLDQNGWPKHLNVDIDCPGPDPRVRYFHEFRTAIGYGRGHTAGFQKFNSGNMDFIRNYFASPGITFHIGLTSEEALAVPFFTNNVDSAASLKSAPSQSNDSLGRRGIEISISRCPGSFRPEHAASETCLRESSSLDLEILPDGAEPDYRKSCVLSRNKRYFFNYRPLEQKTTPVDQPLTDAIAPDIPALRNSDFEGVDSYVDAVSRSLKRNGMYVGAVQHVLKPA